MSKNMASEYPTTKSAQTMEWEKRRAAKKTEIVARQKAKQAEQNAYRVRPSAGRIATKDSYSPAEAKYDSGVQQMDKLGQQHRTQARTSEQRVARRRQILNSTQRGKYRITKKKVRRRRVPDSENGTVLRKAGAKKQAEAATQSSPVVLGPGADLSSSGGISTANSAFDSMKNNAEKGNRGQAFVDGVLGLGTLSHTLYESAVGESAKSGLVGDGLSAVSIAKDSYVATSSFSNGNSCDGADAVGNAVITGIGMIPMPGMKQLSAGGTILNSVSKEPLQKWMGTGAELRKRTHDQKLIESAFRLEGQSPEVIRSVHRRDPQVAGRAIAQHKENIRQNSDNAAYCREEMAEIQLIREALSGLH